MPGPTRRAALADSRDAWLASLLPAVEGAALVAVGSLGRRDCVERSDLDVVMVHSGLKNIGEIAEQVWYPIWDAGLGLDHSVRTVAEAARVGRDDVKAALGMLDGRYVAGDRALADAFVREMRKAWRTDAPRQLDALHELTQQRWQTHGELAFLLEGDLKETRGGLRDFLGLRGIAYAQVADVPGRSLREAYDRMLDVRDALHRASGRAVDRLLLHDQDAVAQLLGLPDADHLLRRVASDARMIAYAADTGWLQVERWLASRRRRWSPRRGGAPRRPLADGVVEQDGEIVLARDADPHADPVLALRVAAAAATANLPVGPYTLGRLAAAATPMPPVWSEAARRTFVTLLGAGPGLVPVWEAFDQYGIIERWIPEWTRIRSLPQRNAVHRFTVDRHMVETAARAAAATRRVARPDLLLLAALLHDIGKGLPGDHSTNGAMVSAPILERLGLPPEDAAVVRAAVQHHLLLPNTATRRDLGDPMTIRAVADAVEDDPATLDLLHVLTEADAAATGPAAWSEWKAALVTELVRRTRVLIGEGAPPPVPPPSPELAALVGVGEIAVRITPETVAVVAPDSRGLLANAAGVLSLHRLDVLSADLSTMDGMTVVVLEARPRFGTPPDAVLLAADLRRALQGQLDVAGKLAARDRAYTPAASARVAPPRVLWIEDVATDAVVLELRAADSPGLLHRVTEALENAGAHVYRARVSTMGADVVDAFYLRGTGRPDRRAAAEQAVLAVAAPRPR
ncbi:MAG TPA: [protein-PII] uridylyltransferase [Mycobacteriales bacterium]